MSLKTSKRISVFGFDAIHIGVDEDITLYYGDSKMYKIFNDGLNSAIKKFKNFRKSSAGAQEDELNIISSHIDSSKFGEYH